MWEPVALPFKNDTLPLSTSTLPSADEIRACSNVLQERRTAKVVAVNDEIVVKFGTSIEVCEGQGLIYLERHVPGVSAPRLYAMYEDSEQLFLVMQRASGVQLGSLWPSLTEPEKVSVVSKLGETFDAMRGAQCPWPGFFGGVDGGSVHDYLFYSQKGDMNHLGPFHDEAAFVAGLTENYRNLLERNGRQDFKARYYEANLGRVLQNHRPTLTHGDLHQKNIMVAEDPSRRNGNHNGGRSFNVVLVDWDRAGWYPDFWEFFRASTYFDMDYWQEDWCWRAQQFLQVWPAETAMMRMFDKDLRGW